MFYRPRCSRRHPPLFLHNYTRYPCLPTAHLNHFFRVKFSVFTVSIFRMPRRSMTCSHTDGCQVCKTWKLKAKANGRRCASMYWAMTKIIEGQEHAVDVGNDDEDHHVTARQILDGFQDVPAEASDIRGDCCVCYESFNTTIRKPVAFNCGHVMCLTCVSNENIRDCPKCSGRITKIIPLFL